MKYLGLKTLTLILRYYWAFPRKGGGQKPVAQSARPSLNKSTDSFDIGCKHIAGRPGEIVAFLLSNLLFAKRMPTFLVNVQGNPVAVKVI